VSFINTLSLYFLITAQGYKLTRFKTLATKILTQNKISTTDNHNNYIEFKGNNLEAIKEFYMKSFSWSVTDYGPTYTAFNDSGLQGGVEKSDDEIVNAAMAVLKLSRS